MGINVHIDDLDNYSKYIANKEDGINDKLKKVAQRIQEFIDNDKFQGQAYTNAKQYFQNYLTIIEDYEMVSKMFIDNCDVLKESYISKLAIDLQQDQLEEDIEKERERLLTPNSLNPKYQDAFNDAVEGNEYLLASLEQKLDDLITFNDNSTQYFDKTIDYLVRLQAAINELKRGDRFSSKSGFNNNLDKTKFQNLNEDMMNNIDFLKRNFGFDERTVNILRQLKSQLSDKDYNIMIASIWYGKKDGPKSNAMWQNTIGFIGYDDLIKMGIKISKIDYDYMAYKLGIEHQGFVILDNRHYSEYKHTMEEGLHRKLSNEEFEKLWAEQMQSFKGKGDFVHQAATMATFYNGPFGRMFADSYNFIVGGSTHDAAGWLGDAKSAPFSDKAPEFGNDDFQADLDEYNIAQCMSKGISYSEASENYYSKLNSGRITRISEFLKYKSYNEVKSQVLQANNCSTLSELKQKAKESFRFLETLKSGKGNNLIS